MTMTRGRGRGRSRSRSLSGAGAGNFKNGRLSPLHGPTKANVLLKLRQLIIVLQVSLLLSYLLSDPRRRVQAKVLGDLQTLAAAETAHLWTR